MPGGLATCIGFSFEERDVEFGGVVVLGCGTGLFLMRRRQQ